ncbi:hypothetical protein D0Y65_015136 [Glycine soja]|uniref:Uncharacterized protein n=1 Tax=Glycine soja TaxID=3848 RepID=A0A445KBT7_GLYSO|nr:hypothetical protein D0Y65_015136 [Glycine soja]
MKKSTSFEDDVINDALAFFIQDQGEAFKYECAWHEVRNQAKWLAMYGEGYSKRTKTSASWAYTSSSQSNTTTNCEFYPTSSLQCPMGTKMAKRKAKEKSKETNFDLMEIKAMQELLSQHPGPLGPSRIFLQKAVASGGSNLARLGELGGNHLPYFAINRGGSEEEKGSAPLALLSLSNLLGKIVSVKKI